MTRTPDDALRLERACFTWPEAPRPTLVDVDLACRPGELVGLLGPNGSGKSTLLKLAAGLVAPGSGTVRALGLDPARTNRREVARSIALVPTSLHVPFPMSVRDFVALGRTPHLAGFFEGPADRAAIADALAFAGVGDLADRSFQSLSTGEAKRVLAARAHAQKPRLLLLDEPTASLDLGQGVGLLERVRGLARDTGVAVVAAIHDLNLGLLYCDRLVLLSAGRVVASGEPEEVVRYPAVRAVFGCDVYVGRNELNGRLFLVPMGAETGAGTGAGTGTGTGTGEGDYGATGTSSTPRGPAS